MRESNINKYVLDMSQNVCNIISSFLSYDKLYLFTTRSMIRQQNSHE